MNYIENRKYFKLYAKLPLILAIITVLSFFVWAIIDATSVYAYGHYKSYGIWDFETGFGCWIVWMLISIIPTLLTYFITKIAISYKICVVLKLEEISKGVDKANNQLKNIALLNEENKQ